MWYLVLNCAFILHSLIFNLKYVNVAFNNYKNVKLDRKSNIGILAIKN